MQCTYVSQSSFNRNSECSKSLKENAEKSSEETDEGLELETTALNKTSDYGCITAFHTVQGNEIKIGGYTTFTLNISRSLPYFFQVLE